MRKWFVLLMLKSRVLRNLFRFNGLERNGGRDVPYVAFVFCFKYMIYKGFVGNIACFFAAAQSQTAQRKIARWEGRDGQARCPRFRSWRIPFSSFMNHCAPGEGNTMQSTPITFFRLPVLPGLRGGTLRRAQGRL